MKNILSQSNHEILQQYAWSNVLLAFDYDVHYRHSREKKKAYAAILEAAAGLGRVRLIGGKLVINILPQGALQSQAAVDELLDLLLELRPAARLAGAPRR